MPKTAVADFDPDVCTGDRADVSGPCPELADMDESTGNGMVDKLSRVEGAAIEAATGEQQQKCGMCGCPLANLGAFNRAPEGCPRVDKHDGR